MDSFVLVAHVPSFGPGIYPAISNTAQGIDSQGNTNKKQNGNRVDKRLENDHECWYQL